MATYQERLADAQTLCPGASSPDEPNALAAADELLRILGYDNTSTGLWIDEAPAVLSSPNYSGLLPAYRASLYDRA